MLAPPARKTVALMEYATSQPRIDRQAGILRGVKLLGFHSKNGREYSRDAVRNAVGLYEGKSVFVDHPARDKPNSARSVRDLVGHLSHVRFTESGLIGDLTLVKSNPLYEMIVDLAESGRIGMSHNADGIAVMKGGVRIVESIDHVRSVDIVINPATTKSLFESMGSTRRTRKPLDLAAVRTIVKDRDLMPVTRLSVIATLLCEMDGMADVPATGTPHESTDIESRIIDIVRDSSLSIEAKLKAISQLLNDAETKPAESADDLAAMLKDPKGLSTAMRENLMEGASHLATSLGGRPIAGTQHAADRAAGVERMIALLR